MQFFPGLETSESRSQTIAALSQQQLADPTNLVTAHTLGLVYYWGAAQVDTLQERFTMLEGVIPNWAVVLESDDYWKQWCAERQSVYGEIIDDAAIRKARGAIEEHILRRLTETASELADAFHLEVKAIQLLRQSRSDDHAGKRLPWGGGPLMIKRLGLEADVAEFFSQSVAEDAPDFLQAFRQLFAQDASTNDQPPSRSRDRRPLMQCFSQLALPALYVSQGQPERALEALTRFECADCAGYSFPGEIPEAIVLPRVCAPDCPRFASRNPAYARLLQRGKMLWQHAVELTAEAHLRLAEQCLVSTPLKATLAVRHWQDAIAVASAGSTAGRFQDAITDMALGRATSLDQSGRLDDAVLLLEAALAFDKTQRLSGKQAELLTNRGIVAGNAGQWENAVADLRHALALNPHLPRTRHNLVMALRGEASQHHAAHDDTRARALLEESVQVLQAAVESDPQDEESQNLLSQTRAELSMLGGPPDTTTDPFQLLRDALDTLPESGAPEPVMPPSVRSAPGHDICQRAKAQSKRGEYAQAIADLEKALRVSPHDRDIKNTLIDIIEEYADYLLGKRQFDQAAFVVERGLGYAPDHDGLKATLAAIRLFQPLT